MTSLTKFYVDLKPEPKRFLKNDMPQSVLA